MRRISFDSSVTLFILHRSEKRQFRISVRPTGALRPHDTICSGVISYWLRYMLC